MEDGLFQELLSSAKEARAIHEGEQESRRAMRYHGKILVAIEEEGQLQRDRSEIRTDQHYTSAGARGHVNSPASRGSRRPL